MLCRKCSIDKSATDFQKGRRVCKSCINIRRKEWKSRKGRAYISWSGIIDRCVYRELKYYSAKGITVCKEWLDYQQFLKDMGEPPTQEHSIDRIDSGKGYYPENCRWATRSEQQANLSNNHMITVNGETLHLSGWAKRLNTSPQTIWQRIYNMGWSEEKAVTTPIRGT